MKLLPVQSAALTKAFACEGFAYYMDMGLGKTFLVLTEAIQLQRLGVIDALVVVAPNSFKTGWVKEIEKQGLTSLFTPHIFRSSQRSHAVRFCRTNHHAIPVLILNYEALRSPETQKLIREFTSLRRCLLAFDESIKLKDRRTAQTKAALKIAAWAPYKRLLSGKPITQSPLDLWPQLTITGAYSQTFTAFRATFVVMGGYMDKVPQKEARNPSLLQRIIDSRAFVAKKRDWLENMPEKVYTIRNYHLGDLLSSHYDSMRNDFLVWLDENRTVTVSIALTKYMKLQQIMCGFVIAEDGSVTELVSRKHNPRLNLLKEILDEEVAGKACVVFKHRAVGAILLEELHAAGYRPVMIWGGMKGHEVELAKETFNTDPRCRVILLQAEASKYGHTLLGDPDSAEDFCSTMLFFENSYSLDTRSQIEDRIHRVGQKAESCLYLDFVGTEMDARIINALQMKESMYQALFGRLPLDPAQDDTREATFATAAE